MKVCSVDVSLAEKINNTIKSFDDQQADNEVLGLIGV